MVNLSSNLNQSVLVNNKSKIPIRIYMPKQQTNASIINNNINLKTNKYNFNFKSNSTLNINTSKIPKLTKIMNDSKMETSSILSTNTFNISSTDKLLRERKYKRSQSFNTDTSINQSSLSAKSTTTASSTSLHSYNSNRNSQDLIKFIKKKLKDIEKSHNFDELSQILCDDAKINNKRITLEQLRIKYNSKSLPNSQLSHANKLINKFKTSNTPEQENRNKQKHRIIEAYFHNLKQLDQYFKSAERELFDKVLQDSTNSTKIKKYQKILQETIEKFNLIINDKDSNTNNLSLLSPESYAISKQDYYKNGEFILRLISDLIFKFRICLKLYDKINEINYNYKLPQIQNKITELQNSLENFNNESFIKETDCSSIMSDDDNDGERDSKNSIKSNKKEDSNPIEDYKQIKKRILLINEDLSDLNMYLDSLNLRAERCSKLEEQLKTDRELIKKTEINLRKCESSDIKLKSHLEKQLEYLKYKFKVNLQDYNIEKLCAHEIYSAISDTEFKIYKLNSYLQDLNRNLVYCQSKINLNKSKKYVCNLSDVNKMKNLYPRHLPPIQHTRDLSLQQFH